MTDTIPKELDGLISDDKNLIKNSSEFPEKVVSPQVMAELDQWAALGKRAVESGMCQLVATDSTEGVSGWVGVPVLCGAFAVPKPKGDRLRWICNAAKINEYFKILEY